jgi:hypothetical protein
MIAKTPSFLGQQISYRFNNGIPNQLTQRVGPTMTSNRTLPDAFFVQDQWTRSRLTLQGGLRYEHVRSFFPDGENGVVEAHRFGPAFLFPRTTGVRGLNDITPRMGASYDLFGNGKTALKVSMSKYLQAAFNGDVYTISNPAVTLQQTTSRGWTDANQNFVAECDFLNPAANGECQAWTNLNWGQQGLTTTVNPDVLEGWGKRNWDWQFSAGIQHEVLPRVSLDVSYSRRWWGNFFVNTHNRALTASDYDEVTLTAPLDSRLPGGGGYPVTFLTRNNNSLLGATDPFYTSTSDFGEQTNYWQGVDVTVNARLNNSLTFQGGTSSGRGYSDTCDVLVGRFGRPMTPSTARVQRRRALDHHRPRPRVVHDSEGRCPGQRDLPLPGQRPAGRRCRDERRVAVGELRHDGTAIPGRDRAPVAHRRHQRNRQHPAAWRDLRPAREQPRHASREGPAFRGHAGECRCRLLQPDERQHRHDVRSGLRSGDDGRTVDAPDRGAAATVRAVQRPARLLGCRVRL